MSTPPSSIGDDTAIANKRRSGRVIRKPETLYAATPADGAKRKRTATDDDQQGEDDDENEEEDESDSEEDDDADEEEVKDKSTRKAKTAARKPAAKRPKPNGEVNLPIRATTSKARRPAKRKAKTLDSAAAEEAGGLYAEVFARGHTLDDVVAEWIRKFNDHESAALAELINFVLRCAGCDGEVTQYDIEDPDCSPSRLGDLQQAFQAVSFLQRLPCPY